MRLFIAIHPPEALLRQLEQTQQELKQRLPWPNFRWTGPGQMHLTLRFLGQLPEAELDPVLRATELAACQSSSAELEATGLACFPSVRRPRVLWAGLSGQLDLLEKLYQAINEQTRAWGEPDPRPFHPHFTLARIKDVRPVQVLALRALLEQYAAFRPGSWRACSVELMESELTAQGPQYRCRGSFALRSGWSSPD